MLVDTTDIQERLTHTPRGLTFVVLKGHPLPQKPQKLVFLKNLKNSEESPTDSFCPPQSSFLSKILDLDFYFNLVPFPFTWLIVTTTMIATANVG